MLAASFPAADFRPVLKSEDSSRQRSEDFRLKRTLTFRTYYVDLILDELVFSE